MNKFYFLLLFLFLFHNQVFSQFVSKELDNIFTTNISTYNNKVVCIVTKDDNVVYQKSFGTFNINSQTPIASATKTFSALVVLSLVKDNLISLDDNIGKYLPLFNTYGKGNCTIRQCFSHTGGWHGNSTRNYEGSSTMTLAEAVDSIAKYVPMNYTPGKAFEYGGLSMHIIGRIAEVVTGKSWNTIFQERVYAPLGLSNTSFCLVANNPRIAGGICSNATDIKKLADFILHKGIIGNDTIIKPTIMEEMWKDQTNKAYVLATPFPINSSYNNPYNSDTVRYGIGTWLDVYNPNTHYQEQISGAGAFGTYFWIDRCRNITGVILTNGSYNSIIGINFQIVDAVRSQYISNCSPNNLVPIKRKLGVSIYPNPCTNQFKIELAENSIVTIKDISGKTILREKNASTRFIDTQNWKSGMYFVTIFSNHQYFNSKIIKE